LPASLSWAAGSLYARHAPLPKRALVSTCMQMITGGGWLLIAATLRGELGHVRPETFSVPSILALAYLVVLGSIVAFTAYTWLIRAAPTPLVATYAYVNPVVAVGLGWAFASEPITLRMVGAGAVIVVAVVLIASGSKCRACCPTDAGPALRLQ
jgi:drug/metabolite transporter (DMT)-like permease